MRQVRSGFLAIGLLGALGCGSRSTAPTTAAPSFQGIKIVVGAVGDPAILTTLAAQRGEWSATRGAEVTVQEAPIDPKSVQGVDVLLFAGDRLGDLVETQALAVLPESVFQPPAQAETESEPSPKRDDPLQFADIVSAFRDQVTKYGSDRMAVPYGGSGLVLAYDRGAFEREANRAAAREVGLALEPPKTWAQFDALARFFQGGDWDGDGSPDFGVALAFRSDAERLNVATFLARAASLGQHRDQYSFLFDADSMAPRIDSPPFVEALRDWSALRRLGPPGLSKFNAEAARQAFRQGHVALLIDRAETVARWSHGRPIGVTPLPGSERVYDPSRQVWEAASPRNQPCYLPFGGGWLVGISTSAVGRRRDAAIDFAKDLVGPETSSRAIADRAFPMLPVRGSQLGRGLPDPRSAPGVDPRQWSDAVSHTLNAARVVPGLRIPEANAYLADLDKALASSAEGEPADRALQAVAKAWTARTRALGTERQLWHYRRSLNSLATLPEPPGR